MRFLKDLWTLSVLYLAVGFLPSFTNAYGQTPVSQEDSTKVLSPAPGPFSQSPRESSSPQPKVLFAFRTDSASILRQSTEPDSRPLAWTSPDGPFDMGQAQGASSNKNTSNPGRKIRKVPLIFGIAGAVVMAAGIVVAADSCGGIAPCFRTYGLVAAGAGGAVAVTGFYFAFKR